MAFFGGLGTISGPLLGALVIEPAQQYLTLQYTNEYLSEILLGALFLVVLLALPTGVIPAGAQRIASLRARRRPEPGQTPGTAPPGAAPAGAAPGGAAVREAGP
jgi:hypothetical protein